VLVVRQEDGLALRGQTRMSNFGSPGRGHGWANAASIDRMAVKLNERAYEYARDLIVAGSYVIDDRDGWSEHQPSARQENDYIERHGIAEYAKWHLGVDDEMDENRKGHYKFPYGDFQNVHRCALLAAESRAGQRKYYDIELAVAHLHGMLEALRRSAVTLKPS
jgi:hypothetical protein